MDCYNQKKLVEIDSYLMNAGKPWRKTCKLLHLFHFREILLFSLFFSIGYLLVLLANAWYVVGIGI